MITDDSAKIMDNRMRPAAFIDRDGVINEERGYVHSVENFLFLPKSIEGLQRLQNAGYILIIITNQAGIARGYYSEDDFHALTRHMILELGRHGVHITATYYCPHHPSAGLAQYKQQCSCRKPQPGMIFRAANDHSISLSESVLIGDKGSDIKAGKNAGVGATILVKSGHAFDSATASLADHVCEDLHSASLLLMST